MKTAFILAATLALSPAFKTNDIVFIKATCAGAVIISSSRNKAGDDYRYVLKTYVPVGAGSFSGRGSINSSITVSPGEIVRSDEPCGRELSPSSFIKGGPYGVRKQTPR